MDVIIGGAYNGKRAYVEQLLVGKDAAWYAGEIPETVSAEIVVLTDFEQLVGDGDELEMAQALFVRIQQIDAHVVCVCTDIGRGIVPMERRERLLRDTLGRLYQLLFREASTVTRIWYGLAQPLK